MNEILDGVRRIFWNPEEKRLRALFRVPVALAFFLLAFSLVFSLVSTVGAAVGVPADLSTLVAVALLTVGVAAITWFIDRRHLGDMGLALDRQWGRDLLAGLLVGFGMVVVVVAVLIAAGVASLGTTYAVDSPDFAFGSGSVAAGVVYGFLFFAGLATFEELLLRGYLLVNVAEGVRSVSSTDRRAVLGAIGVTAGLFGILHAANPGGTALSLVNIAVAGLFFGVAYAVTHRLAFPIGAHVSWNFGLGSVFGLPVSGLRVDVALLAVETDGPQLLTGGSFGPEGGIAMLVALAAGTGALVVWTRSQYGTVAIDERIAVPDLWTTDGDDS